MNKLCSRNTALATAAGRSGCAPVVSQPLAVFSPFDVLVRFILSLRSFRVFLLLRPLLSCISLRYPRSPVSFPQPVDAFAFSHFLPPFLFSLFRLFLFILNYIICLHCLARSFFFTLANDLRYVSPSSFLLRSLSRSRSRVATAASQSAHGILRSLLLTLHSVFECASDRTNIK